MDAGTILGFILGYFATAAGVFLLYLPVIVLVIVLLIAGGVLQLLLLPFVLLVKRIRRSRPKPDMDGSWLLNRPEASEASEMQAVQARRGPAMGP